jgi:hypothetical protein
LISLETLRRCQPNRDTLDLTYRLAADYERRRDILKAAQAYRYISECDATAMRLKRWYDFSK